MNGFGQVRQVDCFENSKYQARRDIQRVDLSSGGRLESSTLRDDKCYADLLVLVVLLPPGRPNKITPFHPNYI